jgi:hypothetical protein
MTRARRPEDWDVDIRRARLGEARLAEVLRGDRRIVDFEDQTSSFDALDFSFTYEGQRVLLDLKEKHSRYSSGVSGLWPEVSPDDLFIVDETVYRRVVWQGGGGYLVVHDHPGRRWAIFGPWELTLGPRVRYQRREVKIKEFLKGKVLLNLTNAGRISSEFAVSDLLAVVAASVGRRDQVEAVAIGDERLPSVG